MAIVVGWFSLMPFLAPALLQSEHASLKTLINAEGLCFQTTDYTCGPAAAVTALGKLGIDAEEGNLAILAHSSPVVGTLPQCLSDAIDKQYSSLGLESTFRMFNSVDQLKEADYTLVIVKDHFLSDHCIVVLEVRDDSIVVADPVRGKEIISRQSFENMWRFSGITINRRQRAKT
jgi:predicted double-glycine peptidase